MLEDKL